MGFKKRNPTKYTTQTPAVEYNDGANWVALASQDFVNAKQITLSGAVVGAGVLGSISTTLGSSQAINFNPLVFNWSNLAGLPSYQLTHSLPGSASDSFVQDVKMGSGATYRGWRSTYVPGSSSSVTGSFSLQFWHAATSSYLTPFSITSFGGVLTTRFSTDVDLGNKKLTSLGSPSVSTDGANMGYVDAKIWNINTQTSGQLAISRLNGYPASTATFLRGDGSWATPIAGVGTVTSVACTGSTGLTISGSPITASGTIGLTLGSELQALSGLNTLGIVCRTAANTYVPRNFAVGAGLSVTNPAGTAGNPTISLGTIPIANLTGYPASSSSFLRGDGIWSQVSLASNVTGSLPISSLSGYPHTTATFLRGDGGWHYINLAANVTGSLPIANLSGYPANAAVYLSGNGTWTTPPTSSPYINSLPINGTLNLSSYGLTTTGNVSVQTGTLQANNLEAYNSGSILCGSGIDLSGYSISNVGVLYLATLAPVASNITCAGGFVIRNNKIYGDSAGANNYFYCSNGTWYFSSAYNIGVNYSYGYLNGSGNTGTSYGTNYYSIICSNRIAASEFNATSSKKIKKIDDNPIDLDLLRETFLKIPFRSYEYLDPSDGKGENFGVIAEELLESFPQFVETEHSRYVPNCLQKIDLRLIEGRKYAFVHDFDMSKIDPFAQKIKIVFGDVIIEAKILQLTPGLLEIEIEKADETAVMQELKKDHFFAYGTYEKCPTVTKNKLFEVGLILLQDLLVNANIKNTNN